MSLRTALARILHELSNSRTQKFAQNPLAIHIRESAAEEIGRVLIDPIGLTVKGSAGAGQWAAVPWIAVFDDVITDSATHGYYIVYLFHSTEPTVHLSLNQGTTETRSEFKDATHGILQDRAQLIRRRLPDFASQLPITSIDLGSDTGLPGDYAAGHAMGISYTASGLPSDAVLAKDLQTAISAYKALTFRGGLDPIAEQTDSYAPAGTGTLIERRRYKMHRRIERNPKAAKAAKKHHGAQCQACEFEFHIRYGEIGTGFIEAHHLKPISMLNEGEAVSYDIATDFAVLCSNCHRMIHRTTDPSDMNAFQLLIKH